eukprot:7383959-Prymnesium_polylepis.2
MRSSTASTTECCSCLLVLLLLAAAAWQELHRCGRCRGERTRGAFSQGDGWIRRVRRAERRVRLPLSPGRCAPSADAPLSPRVLRADEPTRRALAGQHCRLPTRERSVRAARGQHAGVLPAVATQSHGACRLVQHATVESAGRAARPAVRGRGGDRIAGCRRTARLHVRRDTGIVLGQAQRPRTVRGGVYPESLAGARSAARGVSRVGSQHPGEVAGLRVQGWSLQVLVPPGVLLCLAPSS